MKQLKLHTLDLCPICHSSEFDLYLKSRDYFLTGETFQIVSCHNCRFKFTNPRPEESDLSKYYESDEYISHGNKARNKFEKVYAGVRSLSIKSKTRIIKKFFKSGAVLDIGSGTGELLYYLKQTGFITKGIEWNDKARNFSINQYGLDIITPNSYDSLPGQSFHVITLWHVLEHVFNLDKQILEIKRLIKENGIIIVALPNLKAYDARFYKKYWAAYDLPRHLYHFDDNSVNLLFEKYGFERIEVKPMYFDSFYVSMLSEKYKTGKKIIFRPLFIGILSNVMAEWQKKNYSSMIYIFRLK